MSRRKPWAWVLPFCGCILVVAMGVRLVGILAVGEAAFAQQAGHAKSEKKAAVPVEIMNPQAKQEEGETGLLIKPSRVSFSEGEIEVLQQLSARREELDMRDQALKEQEAALVATRLQLEKKAAELDTLKQQIEGLLAEQEEKENARLASMVKVYETMKPKAAARIFQTLETDVLLSVVSRMKEAKLSPILAALPAEKAQEITTTIVMNAVE